MSLYDAEVAHQLGKDSYKFILDRVKSGFISQQQMHDISNQLHPHVLGNHLRRKESGKVCDEAEFRHILSDWYQYQMCDLGPEAAHTRLVSILRSPLVNLRSEGKTLEQIWQQNKLKERVLKILVLLGESGAGKSSLGNCLLALNPEDGFKESTDTDSCTKRTSDIEGDWVTNGTRCVIIDTPGLNDSDNEDTELLRGIVMFLRDKGQINNFVVVRNGHMPRMNHSFKSMLSTFELSFGDDFWNHVVFAITHTGYSNDLNEELSICKWKKSINNMFPKSTSAQLETVVLDATKTSHIRFKRNAERLWELVSETPIFECKDLKEVKTENDELRATNKDLLKELERLQTMFGLKVGRKRY